MCFSMLIFSRFRLRFCSISECFFGLFGRSKITSKSSSMRLSGKRKNLKKCCRVASKSRFAGPEVDAKMNSTSNLRPAKNASSANRRKSQIFDRFWVHLRTILGAKIDAKSHHKMIRKSTPQKIDKKTAQKGYGTLWGTNK